MSGTEDATIRARRLLSRAAAWIDPADGPCVIRMGPSRRARIAMTLDEATFRALLDSPGLKPRAGGGWAPRPAGPPEPSAPPPGRPGFIPGVAAVIEADGRTKTRAANLGRSAVAWLAARADPDGRPWLDAAEVAAAERLELEAELALRGPALASRWDALPRSRSGGAPRAEPGDQVLAAGRRLEAALRACGPARGVVEAICIRATALQAAERDLGLRKRSGKALLKQGLQALARHYGIG